MTKRLLPNINRRDFLGGVALTSAAGAMMSPMELFAQQQGASSEYYPPKLTGMRGSHAGSFEVSHAVSLERTDWDIPKDQTDDIYDMVVVGGGISGLSAAFLYQQKMAGARILILDNHDDFGGHAKRNEFDIDGKKVIGYGGSQTMQDPGHYSQEAKKLLKDISIETERFYDYFKMGHYNKWEMGGALYFQKPDFGEGKLIKNPYGGLYDLFGDDKSTFGRKERTEKIREFPISKKAQDALIKLMFDPIDPFQGLPAQEKIKRLRSITYIEYLEKYYDMPKEGSDTFRDNAKGLWGVGWDALSAMQAAVMYEVGMGVFEDLVEILEGPDTSEPYIFHFPDGNAGVARSLVRKLIPEAVPGNTMEDLVLSKVDYSLLDQEGSDNRIRLNSTAVNVRHSIDQSHVDVSYVRNNTVYRVRAKHVIMACYNSIIPFICPEVPEKQVEAINYATKVPLVYTNIALRNWRAFAEKKCNRIRLPKEKLHHSYVLDFPVSMGDYTFSENPDQPILVHATCVPTVPDEGYTAIEQAKMGRMNLYQTSFDDFERSIVGHFEGMFRGTGFDAQRDIAGITVNRWPHGYAYEYNDYSDDPEYGPDKGPHIAGRAQIGRISIANSDASAYAYVNGAIDAAVRAVDEQVKL
ncbi:MAG: NAD(P)-binding protein [Kordiimonadaceae bacterium]|jgi:spermidine dehydrogenase|nr:NAD(P)-binding protein [Kordiimonadaceae bacterium]MBT6034948.1 NAD(P)-binding protein [Kordiimonadaceae bacterium]MBT6330493.1 NAD(P)-binding protein [Kordiimonadaceae bacterium]MBT7583887.1 NAD(P)-binding protein [Kordiimonadaceae bacterium]